MTRRFSTRPQADEDVREAFRYLGREAGLVVANRFYESLYAEFAALVERPEKGSRIQIKRSPWNDLRRWFVSGFGPVLILYRPTDYGIEVVRVLHGARDIARILRRER
jgi:toxin ParE1/3/4